MKKEVNSEIKEVRRRGNEVRQRRERKTEKTLI